MPVHIIKQLKQERLFELRKINDMRNTKSKSNHYQKYQSKYFAKFDGILNKANYGPKWLQNEKIASIVKGFLHKYDNSIYDSVRRVF